MAEDKSKQPVIIKRIKKGGHAAHGGAWKIAYADFVTAMMAFFLLLWLLNSVTQEQLEGISNYFAPVSVSATTSGSGDILGGATVTSEGSAQSSTSRDSVTVDLPPPKAGTGGKESAGEETGAAPTDADAAEELLRQKEEELFEAAKEELEQTIAGMPQLRQLKDSLLIDNTPEGLRIQLMDKEGLPLFPSGKAEMYLHTRRLLELVSKVILKMPQQISISGHTDAKRFVSDTGYSNWELSADRANAARRELVHFKVPFERVSRVVGKAATEPLLSDDPDNARNRRLSIVMLRGTGKDNPAKIEKKQKPKKTEEVLPGLEAIKKRQLEGVAAPAKSQAEEAKAAPDAIEAAKKSGGATLALPKIEPQKGEPLPGLETIKKRQLEEGAAAPAKPKAEEAKAAPDPIEAAKKAGGETMALPGIEPQKGESLPGLEAIRKRQLEKGKTSSPVQLELQPKIDTK
ncbi:MAG: flagellar motor protein MotB [Rhodospirillales bacterium]